MNAVQAERHYNHFCFKHFWEKDIAIISAFLLKCCFSMVWQLKVAYLVRIGGKLRSMKEWLRNKLKALALLPERLSMKVAEVLAGIIGAIISSILNRAKELVG